VFGGGRIVKPIEMFLAGHATQLAGNGRITLEALAERECRAWFRENMRGLDADRDVRIHCLIKPGSPALVDIYRQQAAGGARRANDTSCGAGFAPLSNLEHAVYELERRLNSAEFKTAHPEAGEDIKVMGVRRGDEMSFTVACAIVDRHVADLAAYVKKKTELADAARAIAQQLAGRVVRLEVNPADDVGTGSVYLTVSGTSAEAGDDGEAGRGNRANGLITPYRPMTMESCAGKNPVTHVGKLYNVVAALIAEQIVNEVPEVAEAECRLVSRIGGPISDPDVVDIRLRPRVGAAKASVAAAAERIARWRLADLDALTAALVNGDVAIDRWPLGLPATEQVWRADRRQLVAEIADEADMVGGRTGRPKFSPRVMAAMARVPRHAFAPERYRDAAYVNAPLPIGYDQTISQPFIVALMTELADLDENSRVLEIGTGSGYQAAVAAELAREVYSIEIVEPLAKSAEEALRRSGYANVTVRAGDGYRGWPEHAPFDAVIVTAGAERVPPALVEQLKPGGRMVIPVGLVHQGQVLTVIQKRRDGTLDEQSVLEVAFVPFTHALRRTSSR
jgi:S-adenosylmethionine synthetase